MGRQYAWRNDHDFVAWQRSLFVNLKAHGIYGRIGMPRGEVC